MTGRHDLADGGCAGLKAGRFSTSLGRWFNGESSVNSLRSGGSSSRWLAAVAGALLALATVSAWAQNVAGRFLTVIGDVRVLSPGGDRRPERGGEVREGETILTGAGALTQIRLADGGMLSIRGDTEMKFDRFSHAGENDRDSSMFISLLKGGFRSVTGLIGRLNRDGYRVTTPSATIGIRGTDHEPVVVPPPPPGVVPQVPPGTYDRVYSGETFIQNRQGVTQNIGPNQVGFISIQGAAPAILPQLPPIYRAGIGPAPTTPQGQPGPQTGGAPKRGPAQTGGEGAGPRQLDPAARDATRSGAGTTLDPRIAPATIQTAPTLQTAPTMQTAPIQTAPTLQTAPLQTAPLQTAPIQTAPIQTAPAFKTAPIAPIGPIAPTRP